jgi:ABC-2 type transport system ATP-binding protein
MTNDLNKANDYLEDVINGDVERHIYRLIIDNIINYYCMNFLETEDVVKQFSGHLALDRVSIAVPEGKIFGLLGPNGAGKTTLIRIINRIMAPDSGMVRFKGRDSCPQDIYRIGYMPEERGLYKKMKVGEQALYLARLKGLPYDEAKKRLTIWFDRFEIMSWWNRKLEELSKGMQQKVQFIITVIHDPELLIFDEPFSGFDPINADLLKKEILELKEAGKTIIFSTHNMASVEEICDEIALINTSKLVLSGQVREIRERFKQNMFRLTVTNSEAEDDKPAATYTALSDSSSRGVREIRVRKTAAVSNSRMLAELAERYEILAFAEELPSMNEVFINTVSPHKP